VLGLNALVITKEMGKPVNANELKGFLELKVDKSEFQKVGAMKVDRREFQGITDSIELVRKQLYNLTIVMIDNLANMIKEGVITKKGRNEQK
jgi:hypothetical protein